MDVNIYEGQEEFKLIRMKLEDYQNLIIASTDEEVSFIRNEFAHLYPTEILTWERSDYILIYKNIFGTYDIAKCAKETVDEICTKYNWSLYDFHLKWKEQREPTLFELELLSDGYLEIKYKYETGL